MADGLIGPLAVVETRPELATIRPLLAEDWSVADLLPKAVAFVPMEQMKIAAPGLAKAPAPVLAGHGALVLIPAPVPRAMTVILAPIVTIAMGREVAQALLPEIIASAKAVPVFPWQTLHQPVLVHVLPTKTAALAPP